MSLAHTILGLLQQQEMTGYDLKTSCFNQTVAHLWPADQAQIYRTLDKLEAQGCIVCTVEIQHDRPNRKVYRLTPTGQQELLRWLQTPQALPILRDPLLVQLYFAAQLPNQAIVSLLEQQLQARQARLANCEAALPPCEDASSRKQTMQQMVWQLARQREQTYIEWLKQAIETFRQQDDVDG